MIMVELVDYSRYVPYRAAMESSTGREVALRCVRPRLDNKYSRLIY